MFIFSFNYVRDHFESPIIQIKVKYPNVPQSEDFSSWHSCYVSKLIKIGLTLIRLFKNRSTLNLDDNKLKQNSPKNKL